jgi:hypothetical protein
MPLTQAEQAVFDHLTAEPGPVTWAGPPSPGGWQASAQGPGGAGADPATVRFRKSLTFPARQLHLVDFDNREGRPHHAVVLTWQDPGGAWLVAPVGGGSGLGPYRGRPWVNFSAQWNADMFAAGGHVIGQDAESAHQVRLAFADGTVLDDVVENGVVLFFGEPGVTFPTRVEIRSAAGDLLAQYDEFTDLD